MVPLADHHWSRASASCRARCSPYRRSEVLRASQLPALLILRQPTHPFPSRSSASSPSAVFRIVPFRIYFFVRVFFFSFSYSHVHSIFSDSSFFFFFRRFCVDFRFLQPHTVFPCVAVRRPHPFPFRHSRDISQSRHFSCVSIFIHILLYRCGGRIDGGNIRVFFFRVSAHACGGVGRSCILFTLIFIICVGTVFFFSEFRSAMFRRR